MSRSAASISIVLGAGFTTIATTISDLTVYDGPTGLIALTPIAFALLVAADELRSSDERADLPDGLTDEEIRALGGDPDA
jgi:hypothetical protein